MSDKPKDPTPKLVKAGARFPSPAEEVAKRYLMTHGMPPHIVAKAISEQYITITDVSSACIVLGVSDKDWRSKGFSSAILFPYVKGGTEYGQAFLFKSTGENEKIAAAGTEPYISQRQLFKYGNWDKLTTGKTYFHEGPLKALTEHLLTGANCVSGIGINGIYVGGKILPELCHPDHLFYRPGESIYITFDAPKRGNEKSAAGLEKARLTLASVINDLGGKAYDTSIRLPNQKAGDRGIMEWDYNDEIMRNGHDKAIETRLLLNKRARALFSDSGSNEPMSLVSAEDAIKDLQPLPQLVEGMLPMTGTGMVFGPPGSGKTLALLRAVMDLVSGCSETLNHQITGEPGAAVYVALEGDAGVKQRIKAYSQQYPDRSLDKLLLLQGRAFYALQSDREQEFIDVLKDAQTEETGPIRLIVIDTLAQSISGQDENSAAVMSEVGAVAQRLAREFNALVLFVHHSGKDVAKGPRGSSATEAFCDCALRVSKNFSTHTIAVTKLRDGAAGESADFTIKEVELGEVGGRTITSCYAKMEPPKGKMTFEQVKEAEDGQYFANVIKNALHQYGVTSVKPTMVQKGNTTVSKENVIKEVLIRLNLTNQAEQEKVTNNALAEFVKTHKDFF